MFLYLQVVEYRKIDLVPVDKENLFPYQYKIDSLAL